MTNGLISVRQRSTVIDQQQEQEDAIMRANTKRFFERGTSIKPAADSFKVEKTKPKSLKDYDRFLRKFQYKNALDAALSVQNSYLH